MKRQHPDNPELFWCPKCKTYKERSLFGIHKKRYLGVAPICKDCVKITIHSKLYNENHKKASRKYYENHASECKGRSVAWSKNHKDELKKRYRDSLPRSYIQHCLRKCGKEISDEMVFLVRLRITMKRTLKEFKAWRKEYESNNADVQREQRENEEADGRQGHTQP